jgi:cytidylate kinase
VVARLAEKLDWPAFHREILTELAGDDAVRARLYRSMDERDLGWFENTFRSLVQQEFHKNDYFHRLTEAILCLARKGPAIFVGRSADLILPKDRGLRVKIIASQQRCIRNFADRNGVSLDEARSEVQRIEAERLGFVRNHFHIDPLEPTRFDLLVNVERFTPEQAVELILYGLRMRGAVR